MSKKEVCVCGICIYVWSGLFSWRNVLPERNLDQIFHLRMNQLTGRFVKHPEATSNLLMCGSLFCRLSKITTALGYTEATGVLPVAVALEGFTNLETLE